ncbi:hypothetical protein [Methanoregula sp.]|uniref:hypothetical protein n=1 Tax=Methanoregula sp. TaxID=2052170 RepID=UPI002C7E6D13|nr:hypothetical protein [Methanoregula sp.]HVP95832.1 hypothetical protein [Methanoregula sp.]
MNARAAACISLLLIILCIAPAAAANDQRYGYITLDSVQIQLHNDTALVDMHYTVDEGTRIIFFLLGKQDLRNKLTTILNYNNAQMEYVNLSDAEFVVDQASYSYGNGIYWFPTHQFNVVIPKLTVTSPQIVRNYTNTNLFPDGMGYFENAPLFPPVQGQPPVPPAISQTATP